MINSISSNNIGTNRYANQQSSSIADDEIKALQEQREQVEKQIEKIKAGNASQKNKDELIKPLQEQITQIDTQIQQKQMEKVQKNSNTNTNKTVNSSNTANSSNDAMLLDNASTYNNIKTAVKLNVSLKSTANSLRVEAALDAQRDTTGNASKIIAKKRNKASEYDARANSVVSDAYKKASKINKNNENINNKNDDENKDDKSIKDNDSIEKQDEKDNSSNKKASIDTLA